MAGGPIGKLQDGDLIEIIVDRRELTGSVNFVGRSGSRLSAEEADRVLAAREPNPDLAPDPQLPAETRMWALLQQVGGGTWGGCVYDPEAIAAALQNQIRL